MPKRMFITLCLLLISFAPQTAAVTIGGTYSGRYLCREWKTLDLRVLDFGGGRISAQFTFPLQTGGSATYTMTGQYDDRSGRFQLTPQHWVGRPPAGLNMVPMLGRFDPASRRLTGKIDTPFCSSFELVAGGGTPLPPLPSNSPRPTPPGGNPGVVAEAWQQGLEYWDATMSDAGRAPRESEPIDDVIDWLRKEKFSCLASQHVSWDASGTNGTASDRINTRARFVVECDGNCRGLRYTPFTEAQVYSYGRTQPVPVMAMKGIWFGGTVIKWKFMRPPGGKPPEVYVHQWTNTTFDNGPGCKAPKSDNK